MPIWYLHSAQLIIHLHSVRRHFPAKVCDCWRRKEGGKHTLCQSCSCKCDSLFCLARFNQVILTPLSWKFRQTRNQSTRMHLLKAFNVSFSSVFFPSEDHLINIPQLQDNCVLWVRWWTCKYTRDAKLSKIWWYMGCYWRANLSIC